MKRLLLILTFLCFGFAFAQFAETPQYQFQSTSSYKYTEIDRHYTVPVSEIQQPFTSTNPYRPRRTGENTGENPGYPPSDPNMQDTPVGDPDFFIILTLLLSYFIYQSVKKRKQ